MNVFLNLFGEGPNLNSLQMSLRGVVVFLITLIFIKIAGRRSFSLRMTYDNIITILLGAILSRAVVGASPFFPTVAACLVISILHRVFGIFSVYSHRFGKLIKGSKILLYKNGKFIDNSLVRGLISKEDIAEQLRISLQENSLEDIDSVYIERSGQISFIKKT